MRFKLDENLPRLALVRLVALGWDVHDVHAEGLVAAIVLRPGTQTIPACLECLEVAIRALTTETITASLWIVEPQRVRIRDHPTGA